MSRTFHMQMDVKGALLNWGGRSHIAFTRDDGTPFLTNAEAKAELLDLLSTGVCFLPMSKAGCEGWTPMLGCPGHPLPAAGKAERDETAAQWGGLHADGG